MYCQVFFCHLSDARVDCLLSNPLFIHYPTPSLVFINSSTPSSSSRPTARTSGINSTAWNTLCCVGTVTLKFLWYSIYIFLNTFPWFHSHSWFYFDLQNPTARYVKEFSVLPWNTKYQTSDNLVCTCHNYFVDNLLIPKTINTWLISQLFGNMFFPVIPLQLISRQRMTMTEPLPSITRLFEGCIVPSRSLCRPQWIV